MDPISGCIRFWVDPIGGNPILGGSDFGWIRFRVVFDFGVVPILGVDPILGGAALQRCDDRHFFKGGFSRRREVAQAKIVFQQACESYESELRIPGPFHPAKPYQFPRLFRPATAGLSSSILNRP